MEKNETVSELSPSDVTLNWGKLKDLFVLTYNQSVSLDKQLDVIGSQFEKIIEADKDIKREFTGALKVSEDHKKDIIDIYKLHTDGADKPYEDFESYSYFIGEIKNTDEKSLEAYLAIVSAYTSLEDKFSKLLPIVVSHLTGIIYEYSRKNDIQLSDEQQEVIDTIAKHTEGEKSE